MRPVSDLRDLPLSDQRLLYTLCISKVLLMYIQANSEVSGLSDLNLRQRFRPPLSVEYVNMVVY